MQDCYERYRLSDYKDPMDAILHSIVNEINFKVQFHNHTYYEIFLVFSGGIYHEANGEITDIPCNTILFIRPSDNHRYYQKGDSPCGLIRLWVSIQIFEALTIFLGNSSDFKKLIDEKQPPHLSVTEMEMKSMLSRFEAVFSFPPEGESRRISSLKQLFFEIVHLLLGNIDHNDHNTDNDIPQWLKELCRTMALKDNFTQGIDRLFQLSHISREHISRSFKKYLGISPTEYVNRLRLNYSANQLANTNRKIVDICFDSGFGNLSYFYKCFNEFYRLSPSSYRASKFKRIELP